MLAQALKGYAEDNNVVVFVSGISDPLETDESEFNRERQLLSDTRNAKPDALIVYFSTCSISDPHRIETPYVKHKLKMEQLLSEAAGPWLILRLPLVIGPDNAAKAFSYLLGDRKQSGQNFKAWEQAIRYPIDLFDVVRLTMHLVGDPVYFHQIIDVALRGYSATEVVRTVEKLHGTTTQIELTADACSDHELDLRLVHRIAEELGIEFDESYLDRILTHYAGSRDGLPAVEGGIPIRPNGQEIVFGMPELGQAEVDAVTEVIKSRWIGKGPRVLAFEEQFATYTGAPYAVACSSGTAALHLGLLAGNIGPGDEVLVPTMTFCATAQAVELTGAKPVLLDCEPRSFNLNPKLIEAALTPRTRAIVPVHIAGRLAAMDEIMKIARKHDLIVIEDCAHAIETTQRGVHAGLIGDIGCFSFYATKSITTGEGGMLIMRDEDLMRDARLRSFHGMDSYAWQRTKNELPPSQVQTFGFKYNMTDIGAALGEVQLASVDDRWSRRRDHWEQLSDSLAHLPLILPLPPAADEQLGYHLYQIMLKPDSIRCSRDHFVKGMRAEGIGVGVHYLPLHGQPVLSTYLRPVFRQLPCC